MSGHAVQTVQQAGWSGVTNGALLRRIAGSFDAFITIDGNLPLQQNVQALPFGVVVLKARSNRPADVIPLAPAILIALATLKPGQIAIVS
jgi:hypothetical protein